MTKLSIQLVQDRILAESEVKPATYDKMSPPDTKSKKIGTPKDTSGRITKITQVEVPSAHKDTVKKSSSGKDAGGIPQADDANDIVDNLPGPGFSIAKKKGENSPATPAVKKDKPNQTSKMKEITGAIKGTEQGKTDNTTLPQADSASSYTAKMSHGNATFQAGKGGGEPSAPAKAKDLGGTTRPSHKAANMKTYGKDSQNVGQVNHDGKMLQDPSGDEPATPKWDKGPKGHNVLESIQIILNGKPKATFGVVNENVVRKIVENYRSHGYQVKVVHGGKPAWKSDRGLIKTIFESLDAFYNNAPMTARNLHKAALNKFFSASQTDYSGLYESRQEFTRTLLAAFENIMERADLSYRRKLVIIEGLARIEVKGDIMDLELVTQARDADMALRQFRDEIVETYGFAAKIKHIFIDGEKKTVQDIVEWADSKR